VCAVTVFVYWFDVNGVTIGNSGGATNNQEASGGTSLSGYKLTGEFCVAPVGAAYAKVGSA